jgi:hypothetical protein
MGSRSPTANFDGEIGFDFFDTPGVDDHLDVLIEEIAVNQFEVHLLRSFPK